MLMLPLTALGCDISETEKGIKTEGYDSVLKELSFTDCLGDKTADKDNELVSEFNKQTDGKKTAIALFNASTKQLTALSNYASERAIRDTQASEWLAMSKELERSNSLLGQITASTSEADAKTIAQQALPLKWQRIDNDTQGEVDLNGSKIKLLKQTNCGKAASCPVYESQRDMVRVFNLVMRIQKYTQDGSLTIHYADARLQTARWDSYRSQGQHQYIWELWLNGKNMGEELCPNDPDTGIQRGFCAVPTSQIILMHPDAGLRWGKSAQRSSDLKPAFIIETLGYYHWGWESEQSAKMTNRWGTSLVAAYTNEPSGNKWSYGPMIHFGAGYNIALTRSTGGTWGVLFNMNLADRYFGERTRLDGYLKCLDKPSLGQLIQGNYTCD